jgi:hypothetical protein
MSYHPTLLFVLLVTRIVVCFGSSIPNTVPAGQVMKQVHGKAAGWRSKSLRDGFGAGVEMIPIGRVSLRHGGCN